VKTKTKVNVFQLVIAMVGVFASYFAVNMFNRHFLMSFPLVARMILLIILQWVPAVVLIIVMFFVKDELRDFGFVKEKVATQILIGLGIAVVMSTFLTVIPIVLGFKEWIGSYTYTKPWQFIYQFVLTIFGVALAEEFIFRGFVFNKLLNIKSSKLFAIVVSSALFGFCHIFSGNIIQILVTSIIGAFWCLCRDKIKYCSTLSLIIAHGVYDGLIALWTSVI